MATGTADAFSLEAKLAEAAGYVATVALFGRKIAMSGLVTTSFSVCARYKR